MLIKKIKLHNIRSYSNQVIEFPSGSVLLSGDIGSGKSTILLAIEFALFGSDTERLSGNALLRKGADEASVELTLELAGQEIIIKRGLKKSKNVIMQLPGWIMKNGRRKDAMPVELKAEMMQLLGYPEELVTKKRNLIYRYTVYCPQEEMKLILTDEKEARLDTLRRIFGVDKYKRIKENGAIVAREFKTRQREMEARAHGLDEKKILYKNKKERLTAVNQRLTALVPLAQQLQAQAALKKEQLKSAEEKIIILQSKKRELDAVLAQQKFRRELLEKNELKIKQLGTVQELEPLNELEQREKELNEKITEQRTSQQKVALLSSHLKTLEKEMPIDNVEQKRNAVRELAHELEGKNNIELRKDEIELSIKSLSGTMKEYEVKRTQADDLRQNILQLAMCPTCLQPVSKEHKAKVHAKEKEKAELYANKIQEYREELAAKEQELRENVKNVERLREIEKQHALLVAELKHLEEKDAAFRERKATRDILNSELENTKNALAQGIGLEAEMKTLKQRIEKVKERARAEKELVELNERGKALTDELQQLEHKANALQHDILSLANVEEKLKLLRQEIETIMSEERETSIQCAQLMTERETAEEAIEALEREITEKEQLVKAATRLRQLRNWLEEYFINLMSTIEKHVMLRIYQEFNALFKNWFAVLIADESMSARVDDSFNPMIEQNGYDVDVEYLSGGERTSAALAYRLALNKVVNDVIETIKTKDVLILDEPTEGFSTEQLDRVRDVLDELGVKQVIIVSHEGKVESFVESTLNIVKEEGVSRVFS